jgi:hypothetical protein
MIKFRNIAYALALTTLTGCGPTAGEIALISRQLDIQSNLELEIVKEHYKNKSSADSNRAKIAIAGMSKSSSVDVAARSQACMIVCENGCTEQCREQCPTDPFCAIEEDPFLIDTTPEKEKEPEGHAPTITGVSGGSSVAVVSSPGTQVNIGELDNPIDKAIARRLSVKPVKMTTRADRVERMAGQLVPELIRGVLGYAGLGVLGDLIETKSGDNYANEGDLDLNSTGHLEGSQNPITTEITEHFEMFEEL